jgi:hypothetical protein
MRLMCEMNSMHMMLSSKNVVRYAAMKNLSEPVFGMCACVCVCVIVFLLRVSHV